MQPDVVDPIKEDCLVLRQHTYMCIAAGHTHQQCCQGVSPDTECSGSCQKHVHHLMLILQMNSTDEILRS